MSWEEYFSRPPSDQSVSNSILKQAKIPIVELLAVSRDRPIMVDGIFHSRILQKVSSTDRVVFLMADMEAIRYDFFLNELIRMTWFVALIL